jgi:asparagine synthase (glutamine-hydrolysing)
MCGIVFCSSTGVPPEALEEAFAAVNPRGPDMKQTRKFKYGSSGPDYVMHFARLAIINPGKEAMQPFCSESSVLMGNGEIYNYKDISATAVSDIQAIKVLLDSGLSPAQTCQLLDGDFAFVYSSASGITVGRDPVGVAPLFCAPQENGAVAFASCARALYALGCAKVKVFPPGHYWTSAGGLQRYTSIYAGVHAQHEQYAAVPRQVRCVRIRSLLNKAIDKRLAL